MKEYNTTLIVEMIHHLSDAGFIHEMYKIPKHRNPVIESCFRLGNGLRLKVENKRKSSYRARPKKVKELIDFLDIMKSK